MHLSSSSLNFAFFFYFCDITGCTTQLQSKSDDIFFNNRFIYPIEVNDECTIARQNDGVCKLITECPVILNRIKSGILNHNVCGYRHKDQIVCCPSDQRQPPAQLTVFASQTPVQAAPVLIPQTNEQAAPVELTVERQQSPSPPVVTPRTTVQPAPANLAVEQVVTPQTNLQPAPANLTIDDQQPVTPRATVRPTRKRPPPPPYNCDDRYYSVTNLTGFTGGPCVDENTMKSGVFRSVEQCPYSVNNVSPQRLGYDCCQEVVCCPDLDAPINTVDQFCLNYHKTETMFTKFLPLREPFTMYHAPLCNQFVSFGDPVVKNEYPFMTALGYTNKDGKTEWLCGGTLITDQYILTAGHCLNSKDLGPVQVARLGTIILSDNPDNDTVTVNIIELIPHPNYTRKSYYNDIALLKLERKLQFNAAVRPSCLPKHNVFPDRATAMGWGITEVAGAMSNELMKIKINTFSYEDCSMNYGASRRLKNGINNETQVCVGSIDTKMDTCPGDSGGPLVNPHDRIYRAFEIYGITSVGKSCGSERALGVYTRVAPYVDWIESVVWKQ